VGGVFTILTTCIFLTWFAMEVIEVYIPPGKHFVTQTLSVTQTLNSSWPLQQLDYNNFFVAYKLQAL